MIVTQQAIENHRRILTEMDSKFGGYVGIDDYVAFQLALQARIAELEAMVREVLNNWFISGEAREKALALLEDQVSELTKVYVRKPRYVQWMTDAILGAM